MKSPVLRWFWLECPVFTNFSSRLHFYKLNAKILAPNNEISSRENSANFNFKVIIWVSKRSWRAHIQAFRDPKIQSFGNHNAISGVYWVYYKHLNLIYSENGTYARELHVRARSSRTVARNYFRRGLNFGYHGYQRKFGLKWSNLAFTQNVSHTLTCVF